MSFVLIVWLADVSYRLAFILLLLGLGLMFGPIPVAGFLLDKGPSKMWPAALAGVLGLFMVLFSTLLPSKQGFYQIAAAYGAVETVQYLQQSDDAKRIAGKSIQAIEKMLDDAIEEDKK